MELERLWMLGWTTWLSPTKIPSAKINTARMMVSGKKRQWQFRSYSKAAQAPPSTARAASHHWKWKCLVLHAHLVRRPPDWLRGQSGAWCWLGLCLSAHQPHSGDCSVLPVKHGPLTSAQSLRGKCKFTTASQRQDRCPLPYQPDLCDSSETCLPCQCLCSIWLCGKCSFLVPICDPLHLSCPLQMHL